MGKKYWKQAVLDYISCLTEDTFNDISDEELEQVVNNLLDDEQMWREINETIYWYLTHLNK